MFTVKPTPTRCNKHKHTLISKSGKRIDFSIYNDGDYNGWYQDLGMDTEFVGFDDENFANTPKKKWLVDLIVKAANSGKLIIYNHQTQQVIRQI